MAVSADLLEVVAILEEAGFGALAGELLTEISLGREIDVDAGDVDDPPPKPRSASIQTQAEAESPPLPFPGEDVGEVEAPDEADLGAANDDSAELVLLADGAFVRRRYSDLGGGRGDPAAAREPIPADEQLGYAMRFLELRLVEPMRRLSDAERLAAQIEATAEAAAPARGDGGQSAPEPPVPPKGADGSEAKAIRIAFWSGDVDGGTDLARVAAPGSTEALDSLSDVLRRGSARVVR